MAATIFETLQNADYNIQNNGWAGVQIGKMQLHNAITLLEKGYSLLHDEVKPLLEEFGNVENVPERVEA